MFTVRVSYVAILQQVARCCYLPYVSGIHEILDDGASLYGIELELPVLYCRLNSQRLFFWANCAMERSAAYEAAALQALLALQEIYGFVVLDYSIHSLVLYRNLAHQLFPIANRGVQLARFLISSSQQGVQHNSDLLASARGLIHVVDAVASATRDL
jgi:hypothetical protein